MIVRGGPARPVGRRHGPRVVPRAGGRHRTDAAAGVNTSRVITADAGTLGRAKTWNGVAAQAVARPRSADVTRSLLSRGSPAWSAVVQAVVSATAAQFEWSRAMRVSWTCWAGARPTSLARSIAPVASERTSTANPSGSASAAEASTQLLVMYPTRVIVSTSCSRAEERRVGE